MGLVDNGKQILVFDYKQKGTSEGFNKLLYNMTPKGIIKGGTLVKNTDASIYVTPFLAFFEDISKKIGIRLETTENASVNVSVSKPFVIIRFSWLNLEDNFMDIISVSSTEIEETDFILGRCIFDSSTLTTFDYSKKSWAKSYYDKDIDFEPSFLVSANEPYDNKLKVGKGSAYINGKKVAFDIEKQTPTFDLNVTNGRKDLVVINDDATISIIKGTDISSPVAPLFPVKGLVVAIVTLPPNPTSVNGSFVEYLYNNNFYSTQISNLVNEATSLPTGNTIMKRDKNGRSQVENPSTDKDISNKAYTDAKSNTVQTNLSTHINTTTGVHGATSAPTANKIAIRDGSGRLQVANPSTAKDVANKEYVDITAKNPLNPGNKIVITESKTQNVVPGWYLVEVWGAGGGGGGKPMFVPTKVGCGGGAGGAYVSSFMYIKTNNINIVIGKGGTSNNQNGTDGGASKVTIGSLTLVAAGGKGGRSFNGGSGAGASGGRGGYVFYLSSTSNLLLGGQDGGNSVIGSGGGRGGSNTPPSDIYGGGGGGGGYEAGGEGGSENSPNGKNGGRGAGGGGSTNGSSGTTYKGGSGGDGIVILTPFNA